MHPEVAMTVAELMRDMTIGPYGRAADIAIIREVIRIGWGAKVAKAIKITVH